ncbi:MAG TPA: flagellar basal body P-ring formation chaperone FlgA [Sedimentisphaerales bacterium]|jgi:flagella basal body P-ring formation protein FlgA|nr:flagellar basal body P-ring formation chaperone FlgA [Sedimentisphaerales bacterium]HNU27769.1 flagellar basal body P-ring formation chaperone FlgA [Sedimentisphaerales bacterium]
MDCRLSQFVLLAAILWPTGSFGRAADPASPAREDLLQVHLPREVTVQTGPLTLGQISVLHGNSSLVTAAAGIGLGQISTPGQKAVLDRVTILSRLASHGISADQVRLTGAQAVAVRRYHRSISPDEFIEVGREFLRQHPPASMIREMIPTAKPQELVLSAQVEDLQVLPRFAKSGARGHVAVQITVMADGREIGKRDILFRLKYQSRRVVTAREVAEGTILTPADLRIETVVSDQPEPANWQAPYGLMAVRKLPADMEVRADMVSVAQSPVVIRRNETVVIRIERPGLVVTAVGTVLQEGRTGECVKVRNADSSRVIVCKVNADGTVEPVL